jgi:phage terminase small subunit
MVQYIQEHSEIASRESAKDTYDVLSPYMRAEEKYIAQIMQCSSKLGLSTSDRLKLVVPVKHEDKINKYLKYLEKA